MSGDARRGRWWKEKWRRARVDRSYVGRGGAGRKWNTRGGGGASLQLPSLSVGNEKGSTGRRAGPLHSQSLSWVNKLRHSL